MSEFRKKLAELLNKQSEQRARLAEIELVTDETPELRSEREELVKGTPTLEKEIREAREAVAAEEAAQRVADPDVDDAETREVREIRQRMTGVSDYVQASVEMRAVDGAAAEYNAALKMRPNAFPLHLLAPEARQATAVDTQTVPRRWLDRLFAETAATALGVTMESVPVGVASFPVTTAGANSAQRAKSQAAGDAAWTVGVSELKPKRNAVRLLFNIEDTARIPGLEAALTRDLRMALTEGIDRAIFSGDDGATGNDADITGLDTAAGVTEATLTQANKVKAANTLAAFTELVDGIHAGKLQDLRVVAAIGAWKLWESTIANADAENQTLAAFLREAGLSWMARGEIETATTANKFGAFMGRSKGLEGAGVAAVWEAGELIRDPYSNAAKGEVALTLCYLWDFGLPRPSSFARLKFVA